MVSNKNWAKNLWKKGNKGILVYPSFLIKYKNNKFLKKNTTIKKNANWQLHKLLLKIAFVGGV